MGGEGHSSSSSPLTFRPLRQPRPLRTNRPTARLLASAPASTGSSRELTPDPKTDDQERSNNHGSSGEVATRRNKEDRGTKREKRKGRERAYRGRDQVVMSRREREERAPVAALKRMKVGWKEITDYTEARETRTPCAEDNKEGTKQGSARESKRTESIPMAGRLR